MSQPNPPAVNRPKEPSTPSPARRRLLMAATGALPSVLTLSSGAAIAAGSTTLQCLAPPTNAPQRFSPVDDNWVRAPVKVGELQNQRVFCVTSPSNACTTLDYHANPGSTWVVNDQTVVAGPANDIRILSDRAYGLVYVNRTGQVMTLDRTSSLDVVPVTDSCWTSVLGNLPLRLG